MTKRLAPAKVSQSGQEKGNGVGKKVIFADMPSKKEKYYVVWEGAEPGIYTSWKECQERVIGQKGARFKAYPTMEEARRAFMLEGSGLSDEDRQKALKEIKKETASPEPAAQRTLPSEVNPMALAVDAACSGNPGQMEYRGVYLGTGQVIFHYGPILGTNNIGEFLAIVHALALEDQKKTNLPIYSDSVNAIKWVRMKKCRTTLKADETTSTAWDMIQRAEKWLQTHEITVPIIKWETSRWGEIPADFGRK